ncbi:MAG: CRISPR-associated protein Csx3 [Desulfurococcaceae archaeon]
MPEIDWVKIEVNNNEAIVKIELTPDKNISYEDMALAVRYVFNAFQDIKVEKIKIIGRGPIWLYAALVHSVAHLTKAVYVYDAINKKYVAVVTHSPSINLGSIEE